MSAPAYTSAPASLADLFRTLVRRGLSFHEAEMHMIHAVNTGAIQTSETRLSVSPWRLRQGRDHCFIIEMADRCIDASRVYYRERPKPAEPIDRFKPVPLPPDVLDALFPGAEPKAAPVEDPEARAIGWLAAKPDLGTVKRDAYRADCIETFKISARGFGRVWPVARVTAGLPKHGKPGPKRQRKK